VIFNLKRVVLIASPIFVIILIDLAIRSITAWGIPISILAPIFAILIIALICSPTYDYIMYLRKRKEMYPELKDRALEVAKKKKGFVIKGELPKMPSEWYGWFVKKLEADGLARKDPRDKNQILFLKIIAESHTEDEIMEMNLPMDIGSEILRLKEEMGKKSEEE
jgi:hypothetical protein